MAKTRDEMKVFGDAFLDAHLADKGDWKGELLRRIGGDTEDAASPLTLEQAMESIRELSQGVRLESGVYNRIADRLTEEKDRVTLSQWLVNEGIEMTHADEPPKGEAERKKDELIQDIAREPLEREGQGPAPKAQQFPPIQDPEGNVMQIYTHPDFEGYFLGVVPGKYWRVTWKNIHGEDEWMDPVKEDVGKVTSARVAELLRRALAPAKPAAEKPAGKRPQGKEESADIPRGMGWLSQEFHKAGDTSGEVTLEEVIQIKPDDLQYTFTHQRYPGYSLMLRPGVSWDVARDGQRMAGGKDAPTYTQLSAKVIVEMFNRGKGGRWNELTADERVRAEVVMKQEFNISSAEAKRKIKEMDVSDVRWLIDRYGPQREMDIEELTGRKRR